MSRLFLRNTFSPLLRSSFKFRPTLRPLTITAKMATSTGKHETHELKSRDLFDMCHITAIVTGGGTGIGLMITQALVANGAKVYITGRREEVLESTIDQYSSGGPGSMHALSGDISDKSDVLRLAEEMKSKEPNGFNLLVNNAGIARDKNTQFSVAGTPDFKNAQSISDHFLKTDMDNWLDTMRTNVAAGYFLSMALLPQLEKGNGLAKGYVSQIVNVSSISGAMKGSSGGQFAYASSKAAFTHMSRMLATTFKDVKVRCNVIAPGVFPSEMTAGDSNEDNKSTLDESSAGNPAGRYGHDSDMAASILFLAGKGGTYYNDQILYPDGGVTLVSPAYK